MNEEHFDEWVKMREAVANEALQWLMKEIAEMEEVKERICEVLGSHNLEITLRDGEVMGLELVPKPEARAYLLAKEYLKSLDDDEKEE